jgi:AcrR family transcriptional regulator
MARTASVTDEMLLAQLAAVFRATGYDGASLADLSKATGLQKASLYHRFPDGKRQMAAEVLAAAGDWLAAHVIAPLTGDAPPRERIEIVARHLDGFYQGGRLACLLNMLSMPRQADGPFSEAIRTAMQALIDAFATAARDAGHDAVTARTRAERVIVLIQGALVVSVGLNDPAPFRRVLDSLADELLAPPPRDTP